MRLTYSVIYYVQGHRCLNTILHYYFLSEELSLKLLEAHGRGLEFVYHSISVPATLNATFTSRYFTYKWTTDCIVHTDCTLNINSIESHHWNWKGPLILRVMFALNWTITGQEDKNRCKSLREGNHQFGTFVLCTTHTPALMVSHVETWTTSPLLFGFCNMQVCKATIRSRTHFLVPSCSALLASCPERALWSPL